MKRLAAILLFFLVTGAIFLGILTWARRGEARREQERPAQAVLEVATDLPADLAEAAGDAFEKESGIIVNVTAVTSADLLSGAFPGGKQPDAVLSSQEVLQELRRKKELLPYMSQRTDIVLDAYKDREGCWTGLFMDPLVLAVNEDFAKKRDHYRYTWEGIMVDHSAALSMTDVVASSMAADFLFSLAEHFGPDGAMARLRAAGTHMVQYGKYLSTPSRMAAMGKCDIGISSYNEARRTEKEGLPLTIIYPDDGSPYYLYGAGITAGSRHPERAGAFIDWLLSDLSYQKELGERGYHYLYVNDIHFPADGRGKYLSLWNLDKVYYEDGKKDLVNRWIHEIRFRNKE